MAFDFNWAPQKLPLQMINGRARAAADDMADMFQMKAILKGWEMKFLLKMQQTI